MEIIETYIPYRILRPNWFGTNQTKGDRHFCPAGFVNYPSNIPTYSQVNPYPKIQTKPCDHCYCQQSKDQSHDICCNCGNKQLKKQIL